MAVKLGLEGKLYRNTGTYASPVWAEIKNVKDLTLPIGKSMADTSNRGNEGWDTERGSSKASQITWNMLNKSGDADLVAIRAAFMGNTLIEFAVMDGDIAVAGSEGLRALFDIAEFNRGEPLKDAQTIDVTIALADSDNAPEWLVIV